MAPLQIESAAAKLREVVVRSMEEEAMFEVFRVGPSMAAGGGEFRLVKVEEEEEEDRYRILEVKYFRVSCFVTKNTTAKARAWTSRTLWGINIVDKSERDSSLERRMWWMR
mmetsp:Transcript_20159/g.43494  ORF Transcript_20159/g.43494 Transcript_20159/m.43494 type:complete len:111 (-) Transcript_20159:167-499(-)